VADQKQLFCLIDASGYVFRAYHAIRGMSNSEGMATNAIFGYVNMLQKSIKDLKPTHVAVVMDPPGKSFRHEMYPEYKANRPPAPEDLKEQFPFIGPVTEAMGFKAVVADGFEADDLIATLARAGAKDKLNMVVVSADKDLTQLVGTRVKMFDSMKAKWWTKDAVVEKFGVPPDQIRDLLAIMGDSSDNVPGVRGIGPKGAAALLQKFGSLEKVLARTDEVTAKKQRENLEEHREMALLSQELVSLRYDVPFDGDWESYRPREFDTTALRELFTKFEFRRLANEMLPDASTGGVAVDVPAMPEPVVLNTLEALQQVVEKAAGLGRLAMDTETTSTRPMAANLVGISLALDPQQVFYIPIAHRDMLGGRQLKLDQVREILGPLVADSSVAKVGQNFKYDTVVLRNHGFVVEGLDFDTMIASYLVNPGRRSHSLDNLSAELLGVKMTSYKEVTGTGKQQVTFDYVPIKQAARYAGEDAWGTLLLADKLAPELEAAGLVSLYRDVELPLSDMLANMEMAGVAIDKQELDALSADFASRMARLERDIHQSAGIPFNIASPRQLGEVLFERLKLPTKRKTKTGYSTDVRVLEELAELHELPKMMLEHRSLAKLKSTYSDVLPTLINPTTGRIHSSFNQAVTATGRLSSSDPNLQNIPIRGEEGKRIRAAFVPAEGRKFLSADYSQVELRVMAHLAQDETLMRAFQRGEDIHSRTASAIFGVMPGLISPDMRRVAKTINFGIIYGMSAFRLAREQKVPRKQAEEFISKYFERYSGVKRFLESSVTEARDRGYAETLLKRRRYLPDLSAKNHQVRSMAERMAINTPVQGGAADIVKLAMLKLQQKLQESGLPAEIVLQVHDELVVETDANVAEEVGEIVREAMESAYLLDVPLKVDLGIGDNWAQIHG
jgi:DNA polymerase I